ncbi:lipid-A-disaccharide synthase [Thiohalocapsa halophila]|uniref:Lipid-A-disaccharide synthase n=1 Tax=Thiohalocapsa halophila TaxID=69359 RepID=A0ABS1CFR0_9GAMM|nr:lipid-A-disaccharide synthase [Thiohalocapsa halophila]MBK1630719.1 lipid-A-disaccharide synthase [Thiohalocapsa halophila]
MSTRLGIVANEPSGDLLGAALVQALQELLPDAELVGVAGPRMQARGCVSLMPQERLSVMGLVEVLAVLPDLLRARAELVAHFTRTPPAAFVGVDAPDFNLGLERRLRRHGIPTVHLVSPTVWAWRRGRVRAIRRAVDLMLCIFPFEEDFLRAHGVDAHYIGHPLADEIPPEDQGAAARAELGIAAADTVVALLPGSRRSEVSRLAAPMLETARWCCARKPGLRFVAPMVSDGLRALFEAERTRVAPALDVQLLAGGSRTAIAAADAVLTASGTATLETLLLHRPMLVAYRLNALTFALVKALRLIKVPYAAMANLLAGEALAPEFIQGRCRAPLMGPALLAMLDDAPRRAEIRQRYAEIHALLRRDAARSGARRILELLAARERAA